MTTLQPRSPYTSNEIEKLYPKGLELQLVQVLLRHGERSPVSARFMNAGLSPHWPYCNAARNMVSTVLKSKDLSTWSELQWRRRLETFGADDGPVIASGPGGEFDGVCNPGELTNRGRETTTMLGQRLRHLYVDQLAFMPKLIADADMLYLRCTPIPRALESLQQTLIGLYPLGSRTADFPPPTILLRTPQDETLYPNDGNCRRFAQLSRAFAQRTADRWNSTDDMAYITKKIGKWMPPTTNKDGTESPQPVAVDSHPRLSGIMDTVNSTRAHGPETRLPKEFYDSKFIDTLEKIGVEEWFSGYKESNEYRKLGIGALMGDIVTRMTGSVEKMGNDGLLLIGGEDNSSMKSGRGGETGIKMALSGCHDTTLAAALASLGAFEGDKWPPYTSHIAFELFRKDRVHPVQPNLVKPRTAGMSETNKTQNTSAMTVNGKLDTQGSWWSRLFGSSSSTKPKILQPSEVQASGIARRPMTALSPEEKDKLEGYYVRIRYNDEVMSVPGCRPAGKHLEGDETFCTLAAFKSVVDAFTPKSWKEECASNIGASAFPVIIEPAGYPETGSRVDVLNVPSKKKKKLYMEEE